MAPEASLVVFVVGLAGGALDTLDAAIERSLDSRDRVAVVAAAHLPRDVDAFAEARDRGATAIVDIVTDERLDSCELRVCPVDEPCSSRTVPFSPNDARDARERAIAIVAVAMLPERTRAAATKPRQVPAPAPAPAPPAPPPPPPRVPVPRFQLEAAAAAALGSPSTFGAEAGGRVRAFGAMWARVGVGARAGSLAGLARTVDVPLTAGLALVVPVTRHLALGARADAAVQWRSVTVANEGTRSRWLAAIRAGFEAQVSLSAACGLRAFGALETNLGSTDIDVSGQRARLAPLRVYAEVGPYLTF